MNFTDVSLSKATIQTKQLLANINTFKGLLNDHTKFMAVIKANAYSHGAVPLAHKMEEAGAADYFGVAQLGEALELREAGIETPVLIFNSVRPSEIELAIKHQVTMTVFSKEAAFEIVQQAEQLEQQANVHLKIDTGMARLGVATFEDAFEIYQALSSDFVNVEGIFTHFADAKDKDDKNFTHQQFNHFKTILEAFNDQGVQFELRHSCNTAATINYPDYHLDMVRVGLGLYGLNPTPYAEKIALHPIETVSAKVTYIKDFPAGESVGYSRTYVSEQPMQIATVAIGYADGVAKSLSNKGFFTYQGQKLPILGEVCMDQVMLDCTHVDGLAIGDTVNYFGHPKNGDLLLTEVAETANASQYDLLCRIGNRVKRIYK
ncbi:MAG TPA: alanine racemase [Atopostipes sp.]|nr:alanine racemase [Atopostipes sp.]